MDCENPDILRLSPILLAITVGLIFILSQPPSSFAGSGGWEDKDNDGFSTFQGDCNDNDPNVYPGNNCDALEFIDYITDETKALENDYLSEKQVNGLLDSLQKAVDRLESENYSSAAGALTSFKNKLNSYMNNGTIPAEVGQPLIDQVQMLIDTIK